MENVCKENFCCYGYCKRCEDLVIRMGNSPLHRLFETDHIDPVAAVNNLTPHQLEAVILHELSHIYRYDYFLNLILSFIKTVLYFNPFVNY
jgi:Antirepressor regulating drug resistance, predicted signal transduction N-terminal membrane component